MKRLQVEKLYEAYSTAYDAVPPEAMELDFRVTIRTMQALAEGQPVAVGRLAEDWDMPLEQVRTILEQGEAIGSAQLDSDGNLVGGVLSLIPTHHRIQVSGNVLYAWCAYDAIEAPGLLGKTTQIESTDPITGETIRLTITPDGVADYYPESTLVSVVSPEVGGGWS